MNPVQFQIQELRSKNQQTLLEMIGIVLFCIFVGAFAPSVILSLFYAKAQLLEAPWFYQAIPVATLVLSILYTLYALTFNFLRERQIGSLSLQMMNSSDLCMDLEEKEIKELEKMVDKTLKSHRKAQVSPKTVSKKQPRRTQK